MGRKFLALLVAAVFVLGVSAISFADSSACGTGKTEVKSASTCPVTTVSSKEPSEAVTTKAVKKERVRKSVQPRKKHKEAAK